MHGTGTNFATAQTIDETIKQLGATFATGRTRSLDWRRAQLKGLLRLLDEQEEAILASLAADLRKNRAEALITEIAPIRKEAQYALKRLKSWMRPRRVSTPLIAQPGSSRLIPEPLGTVLIITAWNFPWDLALAPLVGALAAGNCVVLKPSELASHSAQELARLLPQYLDPDAVTVLQGGVDETQAILEHRFDHILFTGGGTVGRIVMTAAAKHLTPVTLELGGKSPVIVDKSADIALTARRLAWAKLTCAGQICINGDYVLVHESRKTELVDALKAEIAKMLGPDPQQSPDYARIVNTRHFDRLTALLDQGTILHGGRHDRDNLYIEPTLIDDVTEDMTLMQDEIFGPLLPILTWREEAELVSFITSRDKPLALYIFADDRAFQKRILGQTSSGNVAVNDMLMFMAVHELPFGGVGASGMGAYTGTQGFCTFSHFKPVIYRSKWLDIAARYAPYSKAKERILRLAWR